LIRCLAVPTEIHPLTGQDTRRSRILKRCTLIIALDCFESFRGPCTADSAQFDPPLRNRKPSPKHLHSPLRHDNKKGHFPLVATKPASSLFRPVWPFDHAFPSTNHPAIQSTSLPAINRARIDSLSNFLADNLERPPRPFAFLLRLDRLIVSSISLPQAYLRSTSPNNQAIRRHGPAGSECHAKVCLQHSIPSLDSGQSIYWRTKHMS
jgi:hypothetical protein